MKKKRKTNFASLSSVWCSEGVNRLDRQCDFNSESELMPCDFFPLLFNWNVAHFAVYVRTQTHSTDETCDGFGLQACIKWFAPFLVCCAPILPIHIFCFLLMLLSSCFGAFMSSVSIFSLFLFDIHAHTSSLFPSTDYWFLLVFSYNKCLVQWQRTNALVGRHTYAYICVRCTHIYHVNIVLKYKIIINCRRQRQQCSIIIVHDFYWISSKYAIVQIRREAMRNQKVALDYEKPNECARKKTKNKPSQPIGMKWNVRSTSIETSINRVKTHTRAMNRMF